MSLKQVNIEHSSIIALDVDMQRMNIIYSFIIRLHNYNS